jgi:hypothetical protein
MMTYIWDLVSPEDTAAAAAADDDDDHDNGISIT